MSYEEEVREGMILDLFAGPGGWSEGLRSLGMSDVGIELNEHACRTRAAAGHYVIRADVATYPTEPFVGKVTGLIASPPCQSFSQGGARLGLGDRRGELVFEPMRWAHDLRPEWIACEQVPEVLPIWKHIALTLERIGYSTATGILNAADYGVPQTRERAILVASRVRPAVLPEPTHADGGTEHGLFGPGRLPWVPMRPTAGLTGEWELEAIAGEGFRERHGERPGRTLDQPSFTVRAWKDARMRWRNPAGETTRFTLAHSLAFQGFDPDYPVYGSETRAQEQIGNAIPPPLAAHIVGALVGAARQEVAA